MVTLPYAQTLVTLMSPATCNDDDNKDNDNDYDIDHLIIITDLPTGGELMCVWVQSEGVGGYGDLIIMI